MTRPTPSAPVPADTPPLIGLQPDFLTLGKPIAGGVPAAVYGFTEEVNRKPSSTNSTWTTPTWAASAGRWRATPCPLRR
ncbi:MAG: hypothetical protein MZV70_21350 [Desulfobacterales bacterium]|nr:hypothetical protein [Desulfobacterales bacterium]